MSKKEAIQSLIFKAEQDIKAATDLFNSKHYDWSLFIRHLAIEKILKALIISLGKEIVYTHDLTQLAKFANITIDKSLISQLNEITTFNLGARYDDYKLSFYRKATKEYTLRWSKICNKIYEFIKSKL